MDTITLILLVLVITAAIGAVYSANKNPGVLWVSVVVLAIVEAIHIAVKAA